MIHGNVYEAEQHFIECYRFSIDSMGTIHREMACSCGSVLVMVGSSTVASTFIYQ